MIKPTPVMDRLFVRLAWDGDCLIYTGGKGSNGYGVIREQVDGRRTQTGTHRVVYRETVGPLDQGQFVCHTCDNPPCCNPAHLWAGQAKDNTQDMLSKGRAKGGMSGSTACRRDHPLTPENTYIFPDGRRLCRTCHREAQRTYRQRRKAVTP